MNQGRIHNFVDGLMKGLFVLVAYFASQQLSDMRQSMTSLQESVSQLNQQIAVLVVRQGGQDHRIEDHEGRLRLIERKR